MALSLIVEDGTGKSTANTYISLADAETYFEGRANKATWTAATDANKNIALVEATRQLDQLFDWYGARSTDDQALRFPRYGVYDRDGWAYDSDEVPTEIPRAVCELAFAILGEDRSDDPASAGLKRVKAGAVEVEFDPTTTKPVVPSFVRLSLRHLGVYQGGGSRRLMR